MSDKSLHSELTGLSIIELRNLLDNKKISCKELVSAYVDRISKYDKSGPKLNSVRELNPDVFEQAAYLDDMLKEGQSKGLLHGIPVLLKDCIDTKGAIHTTCGAVMMKDHYAEPVTPTERVTFRVRSVGIRNDDSSLLGSAVGFRIVGFPASEDAQFALIVDKFHPCILSRVER